MAYCHRCERYFPSHYALTEHLSKSPMHNYCVACGHDFYDAEDLEDHYLDVHRDTRCAPCNKIFKNSRGLHEHYRQSPVHASKYCAPCERLFQSESNLRSHLNSSTHQTKDLPCPAGCGLKFVSRSAFLLHLEAGSCRSGIKRSDVNAYVRSRDTSNYITDPSRLLTASDTTYYATGASWNGRAYECYLCPNEYRTLSALNQHLASPKHQAKIYRCPLTTCQEKFSTLSGLCQHVESGRCNVMKHRAVQNVMDGMVSGMKRLAMT
jgi:Zinc-finger of C2H2 type